MCVFNFNKEASSFKVDKHKEGIQEMNDIKIFKCTCTLHIELVNNQVGLTEVWKAKVILLPTKYLQVKDSTCIELHNTETEVMTYIESKASFYK